MSVSEEEARNQIAQMRAALKSVRASAHAATAVRIVGVIVGLCIVGIYVLLFMGIVSGLRKSPDFGAELKKRWDVMQLDKGLETIMQEVGPVALKEGLRVLQESDFRTAAVEELSKMYADLRPAVESEVARVSPRVSKAIEAQARQFQKDIQAKADKMLTDRLAAMIVKQEDRLGKEAGLTKEQAETIVKNMNLAAHKAVENIVARRLQSSRNEIDSIITMLDKIPPLPEKMGQQQIVDETVKVLLALLKEGLPEYEPEVQK